MQMLKVREVANELDVHELTVRRWIHTGRLEAVRLGGGRTARYRVSTDALDRFLHSPSAPPTKETA